MANHKELDMTEEEIKELQNTNESLVARVTQLESINIDLVDQKKELKDKLQNGFNDEDMKAELDNYKAKIGEIENEKTEIEQGYTNKLSKLQMKTLLNDLKVKGQTPEALDVIADLILAEATPGEDGTFAFLKEDKTTRFNDANKEYSVIDKINELKESGNSFYFAQEKGAGGGIIGDGSTSNPKPLIRTQMSIQEQIDYRQTNGEEAYQALPII